MFPTQRRSLILSASQSVHPHVTHKHPQSQRTQKQTQETMVFLMRQQEATWVGYARGTHTSEPAGCTNGLEGVDLLMARKARPHMSVPPASQPLPHPVAHHHGNNSNHTQSLQVTNGGSTTLCWGSNTHMPQTGITPNAKRSNNKRQGARPLCP